MKTFITYTEPDQLIKGHWYIVNDTLVQFLGDMFNGPNSRQWRFKGEGPDSYKTLTESEAWESDILLFEPEDDDYGLTRADLQQFYGPSVRV
jgi:hypothetical protein